MSDTYLQLESTKSEKIGRDVGLQIADKDSVSSNSFKLSKEAYRKLTTNYDYSKVDNTNRQKSLVYTT